MKRPQWLTRRRMLVGCGLAIGLAGVIALANAVRTGQIKAGIEGGKTVVTSKKLDKQGNVIERTETVTPQEAKTLWDWFSLLGVPATLLLLSLGFQYLQQKRTDNQADLEREIAAENRREEALQTYFDRVSTLLVEKNLLAIAGYLDKSSETDEVDEFLEQQKQLLDVSVIVIRARTLSILRRLRDDVERKTDIIQFLLEAEVISKLDLNLSDFDLSGVCLRNAKLESTDLRGANFHFADLRGAYLSQADLRGAILTETNLDRVDLRGANLRQADLRGATLIHAQLTSINLIEANLTGVDLSRAKLCGSLVCSANFSEANLKEANVSQSCFEEAIFLGTDLRNAKEFVQQQLEGENPPLLCNVALPKEVSINPDRDCELLPQVLLKRHPEEFKNITDAKAYVDEVRKKNWD